MKLILENDYTSEKASLTVEFWSSIFFGLLVLAALYLVSRHNYLLFHSLAELFSIVIATTIFLIIWNSRRLLDNHYFLFLGIALFFVSLIDLTHALTYSGMEIIHVQFLNPANLPTQLWLCARYLQAFSFLIAPFFISFKVRSRWMLFGFLILTAVIFTEVFSGHFPTAYVAGSGLTAFKIISEYIISAILLISIFELYRKKTSFDAVVFKLIIWAIIFSIISELFFTVYVDVYGILNFAGHFTKIIVFYLLYRAIVVNSLIKPHSLLYYNTKKYEQSLEQSRAELKKQTSALQRDMDEDRALLKSITDGLVAVNNNGQIMFANEAFEKITGILAEKSKGEMYLRQELKLYNENGEEVPFEKRALSILFSNFKQNKYHPVQVVHYLIRQEREIVPIQITFNPIIDKKGKILGGIGLFRDISSEFEVDKMKSDFISFAAH